MINFPLLAGISASVLHVVSGPDHLAAVTPLAIETRRKVWKIGFFWGLGHLLGMLLIGFLFLLFKDYLPLEKISEYSEFLVGFVLIAVGVWAWYCVFFKNRHKKNKDITDTIDDKGARVGVKKIKQNLWSSFSIGVLHGLAGIAHFILLLPVLGFENQLDSIQYIFGFGIGTILAMTMYTFFLGQITGYSKNSNNELLFKSIRLTGGLFAIVIGIYWIYLSV